MEVVQMQYDVEVRSMSEGGHDEVVEWSIIGELEAEVCQDDQHGRAIICVDGEIVRELAITRMTIGAGNFAVCLQGIGEFWICKPTRVNSR